MPEVNKTIELKEENLEKVVGGKGCLDGTVVRYTSDEGDWQAGDKFVRQSPAFPTEKEYLILQDNGTYTDIYFGHRYNAKLYREDGRFIANTTITDYTIMMGDCGITFIEHTSL